MCDVHFYIFGQNFLFYFLCSGADVNIMSVNKRTALHEAAQFGFYEVVKLLLEHKANPDIRETTTNNTPAELASLHKHHEVSHAAYRVSVCLSVCMCVCLSLCCVCMCVCVSVCAVHPINLHIKIQYI